jgi:predicted GIY-YIG superfamily endonuclease
MKYVYLIESTSHSKKRYVGITNNLKKRIEEHNRGKSQYTNQFIPWRLVVAMKFTNDRRAQEFERYLKSGSGHAFAKRDFW